jgi:hypothetical protein
MGILLTITCTRRTSTGGNVWVAWKARSAPQIFRAGLTTIGLVDSAYTQNSATWLFIGILLGAHVLAQPSTSGSVATMPSVGTDPPEDSRKLDCHHRKADSVVTYAGERCGGITTMRLGGRVARNCTPPTVGFAPAASHKTREMLGVRCSSFLSRNRSVPSSSRP